MFAVWCSLSLLPISKYTLSLNRYSGVICNLLKPSLRLWLGSEKTGPGQGRQQKFESELLDLSWILLQASPANPLEGLLALFGWSWQLPLHLFVDNASQSEEKRLMTLISSHLMLQLGD